MVLHSRIIGLAMMPFRRALVFSTKLIANQVLPSQGCEGWEMFSPVTWVQAEQQDNFKPSAPCALLKRLLSVEAF